jgi:hypothetical protein
VLERVYMPLLRAADSSERGEEAIGNQRAVSAAAAELTGSLASFCAATQETSHLLKGDLPRASRSKLENKREICFRPHHTSSIERGR